jgi:hypothetical protein
VSAFDDLQRQLLASVARRSGPARSGARLSRWWRGGRRGRGLLLVAMPLVFVAAAAAATIATRIGESPANALFSRVLTATGSPSSGPCRIVGGRLHAPLSDEAPDPLITAVLPGLASTPRVPPSASAVALAEHNSGGAVLARTIREVHLPDGITLIVYVAHGQGPFTLVDPKRCLSARLAELAQLRPDADDPLRRQVARTIEASPDTDPGAQSLSLSHREHDLLGGGASFPVGPRQPLSTGVLFSGSGCERRRCSPIFYGGIAAPKTAYLTLTPVRHTGTHRGRIRRRIAVVEGFFAFTVPRGTGPELVIERARDGGVLAASPLSPIHATPRASRWGTS